MRHCDLDRNDKERSSKVENLWAMLLQRVTIKMTFEEEEEEDEEDHADDDDNGDNVENDDIVDDTNLNVSIINAQRWWRHRYAPK